ncbi:hypothetical protein WJX74_002918 [Apatococcus lobatus]|uniref:Uncharacterized protein n=1 Tax=Apatococcus lobatus TaxID=904363 RepID=A0AAW1QZU4_9CHLO
MYLCRRSCWAAVEAEAPACALRSAPADHRTSTSETRTLEPVTLRQLRSRRTPGSPGRLGAWVEVERVREAALEGSTPARHTDRGNRDVWGGQAALERHSPQQQTGLCAYAELLGACALVSSGNEHSAGPEASVITGVTYGRLAAALRLRGPQFLSFWFGRSKKIAYGPARCDCVWALILVCLGALGVLGKRARARAAPADVSLGSDVA